MFKEVCCCYGQGKEVELEEEQDKNTPSPAPLLLEYDSKFNMTCSYDDATVRSSMLLPAHFLNITASPSLNYTYNSQGSVRTPTLSYLSSLRQNVQFRIGGELLCMSWNIHHKSNDTPFGYYCDFRKLSVGERDCMYIEIAWDVALAFFETLQPIEISTKTTLREIVPSFLLTDDVLSKFSVVAKLADCERKKVMKLPSTSLTEFLKDHLYHEDSEEIMQTHFSFYKTDTRNVHRKSSPLRLRYDERSFKKLVNKDAALLPALIFDSLHVFVIKFTSFLIDTQLTKTFSDFTPSEQNEKLTAYLTKFSPNNLTLPKPFVTAKENIYKAWNSVFQDMNIVLQVERKAEQTQADIVLLQQVTKGVFKKLTSRLSTNYVIVPNKFPSEQNETTLICLNKTTVKPENDKIRRIDDKNFAILCRTCDILYYVCDVHLTAGEKAGELRKSEVEQIKRVLGKSTSVIIGGTFNEDLTVYTNQVAKIMMETYNGIDHTQENPLAYSINRMKTFFQFELQKAAKQHLGVGDGIYSSFPLVGAAFTDFIFTGLDNPSDHGPVFQRIMVGVL